MTTFNSLFGYLETLHAAGTNQLNINGNSYALQRDINQAQQAYYRLGLGKKSDFALGEADGAPLKMHQQHISINNKQIERFAKSPYHYTAYFKNPRGQEYVLHVFFNDGDDIEEVKFDLKTGAADAPPKLTEAQQHAVIELATEKARPVMMALKAALAAKISELKSEYQKAESEATAQHEKFIESTTKKNHHRYQTALSTMVQTLNQLTPLVDPNRTPYKGILQFTTAWQAAVRAMPQGNSSAPLEAEEPTSSALTETVSTAAGSVSSTSVTIRTLKAPIKLDQDIEKLAAAYQAFPSKTEDDVAATKQELDSLLAEIGRIAILAGENNYTASAEALKKLHDLRKTIYAQGETLIVRLLLDPAHVQLAEKWSIFHYVLEGTELLIKACNTADNKALACLLQYGNYEQLEQMPLTINSQTYPSILYYFLALGKEKQKEKLPHVTTLLQHRPAMLLIKEKKTGLPLAHTILTTPGHALQSAIRALKRHQLVKIYKHLIDLPGLSQAQRANYQANLEIEQKKAPLSSPSYNAVFMRDTVGAMMDVLGARDDAHAAAGLQILEQIRNDPDVIAIEKKIADTAKKMYRKIQAMPNRDARAKAMRDLDSIKRQETASQRLEQLTKTFPPGDPLPFDQFKEVMMKSSRNTLEFLHNTETMLDAATRLTEGKKLSKKDARQAEEEYQRNLQAGKAFKSLCDASAAALTQEHAEPTAPVSAASATMGLDEHQLQAILASLLTATGPGVVQGNFRMVPATFSAGHDERHGAEDEEATPANGASAKVRRG